MSHRSLFQQALLKKKNKVLTIDQIKTIGRNILGEKYTDNKLYKLIYHSKNTGNLLSIKKNLFMPKKTDTEQDEDTIITKHYRPLLKKHLLTYTGKQRYIGGVKALELHLGMYTAPDTIDIITTDKTTKETVLYDKTIQYKSYHADSKPLYRDIATHTMSLKIGTTALRMAQLPLALLEACYSPDASQRGYIQTIIRKLLKKHKKTLQTEIIVQLLRLGKHHSSLNRLSDIAASVDHTLHTTLQSIIKKHSFSVET